MREALTWREERFVFEYMKDENPGAAAGRAGFGDEARCEEVGRALLRNPAVRARINAELVEWLGVLLDQARGMPAQKREKVVVKREKVVVKRDGCTTIYYLGDWSRRRRGKRGEKRR